MLSVKKLYRKILIISIFLLCYLFYSKPLLAASWNYTGLDQCTIGLIKISPFNPSVMFASATCGNDKDLFRSNDKGGSWFSVTSISTGLPVNSSINAISFHPFDSDTIFVSVFEKGIYKSINDGLEWNLIFDKNIFNTSQSRVKAFEIHPNNPQFLYVGMGNNNCYNGGLYKSTDGGITWTLKTDGIDRCDILRIVFDPKNPNIIYTSGERLNKSINNGETWKQLPVGAIPSGAIAIHPLNDTLYIGQKGNTFGVFKSTDGGENWQITALTNKRVHDLIIDQQQPNIIYTSTRLPDFPGGGVYKSTNAGDSWTQINEGLPTLETAGLQINYETPKKIFLGTLNFGLWQYDLSLSPVIFLPGFAGSWNKEALSEGIPSDEWKAVPIFSPYKNLKRTLISDEGGYTEDEDYFEFYYDWRKRIDDLTDDLDEYINNNISPEEKVNLVGYSMGGLVARAYGNKYGDEKINKIVTVGSPHKGVLDAYEVWESGSLTDFGLKWIGLQWYLQKHKDKYHTFKDTAQQETPSLQDLSPIFDFLKDVNGSIKDVNSLVRQNEYLKNLNDPESLKEKIVSIHGKENNLLKDTTEYYIVEDRFLPDELLGLWSDGVPVAKEHTTEGDLMVLTKSALMEDISSAFQITGDHTAIVKSEEGIQAILDALEITGVTPDDSDSLAFEPPALVYLLGSPANIKVTTPNNDQVGHGIANPGQDMYYSAEDELIFIANAFPGEYNVELIGTDTGVYHLYIGQLGENASQWQTIKGKITPNEVVNLNLDFDSENPKENPLIDEAGDTFLNLAQQRLELLNEYITNNINHRSTKKRLQYSISRILRKLNRSFGYLDSQKHYLASRYVFSSFIDCHRLRISTNQYLKRNLLNSEESIYIKNELEAIIELLSSGWIELYQNGNKSINYSKILRYQRALERITNGLEPRIEAKAEQGEDKDLGVAFSLVEKTQEKGNQYTEEGYLEEAYINYVSTRMFLLESLRLLR